MADVDAVVVGAGVVGLATARQLAIAGLSVVIVDKEASFGTATSSRSSEVIHAGIYYAGMPLKAAHCVAGRELLYRFCADRHVAHRRLGKLIVAFSASEERTLLDIRDQAVAAGVHDLRLLDGAEAKAIEPELSCSAALLSPSTGIVDSHGYMLALLADAEAHGAVFAPGVDVTRLARGRDGWAVFVGSDAAPALTAARVINAAGHGACGLAGTVAELEPARVPTAHYARGSYFVYHGAVPFSRLIYPVPVPGGLGTHLTLDLSGRARFGPDVEWVSGLDYRVDPARCGTVATAARRIWPALDPDRLAPDYCGIRPKIGGSGETARDFVIEGPADHRLDGLVNLFGIESPGLTASLAIAKDVCRRLDLPT